MSATGRLTITTTTALVAFVLSCNTEPVAPRLIGNTYELRSINGSSLPIRFSETDSTNYYEIENTSLLFTSADSLSVITSVREVAPTSPPLDTLYVDTTRVQYTEDAGGQLRLSHPCCTTFECGGPQCPAVDVGNVQGDTIRLFRSWAAPGPNFLYVQLRGL